MTALPPIVDAHARQSAANAPRDWGADVKRILCIRLDNLGDVLMTTPALHALREAQPGRHLTLLASRSGKTLAPHLDAIDDVIEYDAPWVKQNAPTDARTDLAMRDRLASLGFDAAVIFSVYSQNPLPAAMLCHLAGIPLRLAHCRENPYGLLTDWVQETEPQQGTRHEVERQLALGAQVGARAADTRMRFVVRDEDVMSLAQKLQAHGVNADAPYVVVHPGATAASRRYPPERFAEIIRRLEADMKWPMLVTGSQEEEPLCREVCDSSLYAVNLAGTLTLGELAATIRYARVLVSNNSGPVHLASALNTPVVDLYALTNPQHMPWQTPNRVLYHDVPCRWCYRSVCPQGHHACLNGVGVDDVVNATMALIEEQSSPFTPLPPSANHVHIGNQCGLSRQRGRANPRRRRDRGSRGRALHARQTCEAARAVLDLATALRCDRLLPEGSRHRTRGYRPRRVFLRSKPVFGHAEGHEGEHRTALHAVRASRRQFVQIAVGSLVSELYRQCEGAVAGRRAASSEEALSERRARGALRVALR